MLSLTLSVEAGVEQAVLKTHHLLLPCNKRRFVQSAKNLPVALPPPHTLVYKPVPGGMQEWMGEGGRKGGRTGRREGWMGCKQKGVVFVRDFDGVGGAWSHDGEGGVLGS